MKTIKRMLSLVLALVVLTAACTFAALAVEPEDLPEVDEAYDPTAKLLAEYTFNNENVKDSVGINHAVFYDNKAVSDPVFTEGVVGRGLQLSTKGTGQRYWLDIPYDIFGDDQDTFSVSLWYKASGYNIGGEDSELFSFYNAVRENFLFYSPAAVAFQDKGFIMKWEGANGAYGYGNVITPYQEEEWVHLVVAVEAVDGQSVITAYVNGTAVEVDQGGEWENSLMSTMGINHFTIGGKNPYKGGDVPMCLFYGVVDEVQVYSGALSGEEAQYLYVTQLTAPDPEPVLEPDEPTPTPTPEEPTPTPPAETAPEPTAPVDDAPASSGSAGVIIAVVAVVVVVVIVAVVLVIRKKKSK